MDTNILVRIAASTDVIIAFYICSCGISLCSRPEQIEQRAEIIINRLSGGCQRCGVALLSRL